MSFQASGKPGGVLKPTIILRAGGRRGTFAGKTLSGGLPISGGFRC